MLCYTYDGEIYTQPKNGKAKKVSIDITRDETEIDWLDAGYSYARTRGINEALFKVRVLKNLLGQEEKARFSFFLGAILQGEIDRILETNPHNIMIGGRSGFRIPMTQLLSRYTDAAIHPISDEQADAAAPLGMILVYEYTA